jgi:hypothetical protein
MMAGTDEYHLRLYVTGGTEAARQAQHTLQRLCRRLSGRVRTEVIDVLLHPELMLDFDLAPVPVLVRERPEPRLVHRGTLESAEQVARILELT